MLNSLPWPSRAGEKPGVQQDVGGCGAGRKLSNTDSRVGTLGHTDAAPRNAGKDMATAFWFPQASRRTLFTDTATGTRPNLPLAAEQAFRLGTRGPLPQGALRPWQTRQVSQPLPPSVSVGVYLRTTHEALLLGPHVRVLSQGLGTAGYAPKATWVLGWAHGNPCFGHSGWQGGLSSPRLRK